MNNRRRLVIALGGSALATPFGSFAQQKGKVWRVGFLAPRRPVALDTDVYGAFPRGMREFGYIEGKNLVIEWRFADNKLERLPDLAAELVRLNIDIIVTAGAPATGAAQKATSTIPIIMGSAGDPVGDGFVKSLARPGANITGLSTLSTEVSSKRLEMLHIMVPKLARVAVLRDPGDSSSVAIQKNVQAAAQRTGVKVFPMEVRTLQEVEAAFPLMVREKVGAVLVAAGGLTNRHEPKIAELAATNRLPSISSREEYTKAGGLMSYGPNIADNYRRAATYVDKIFKGAKPADLPVEQPTTSELFINGKTVKALGLKIPHSLQIMANKVIE